MKGDLSLAAIKDICDELDSLKHTLESLAQRCDDFVEDVSYIPDYFRGNHHKNTSGFANNIMILAASPSASSRE